MTGSARLGGEHPGQVGRAAGARDDDPDARDRPPPPRSGTGGPGVRWAETTLQLRGDAELVEDRDGRLEGREVRAAATDDADERAIRPAGHRSSSVAIVGPGQRGDGGRACSQRQRRRSSPSAVTWPILRRSKTVSLVVQVEVDGRVGERRPDARETRRPLAGRCQQVDHRRRRERRRRPEAAARRSPGCAARTGTSRAPSIVQWPLLWTRGASSLTTSEPSASRNSSAVSVPTRSIAAASRAADGGGLGRRCPATTAPGRRTRRGSRRRARSGRPGRSRSRRRAPRATTTDSSVSKSSSRSASSAVSGRPAERGQRAVDLVRAGDPDLAAAVIAAGRGLEPERQAEGVGRGADRSSSTVRTSRQGATAIPAPSTNRRSASRSWVTTQRGPAGSDRHARLERLDDLGGNVLQLVGHDVAQVRQPQRRPDVVVRRRRRPDRRPRDAGQSGSGSRTASR